MITKEDYIKATELLSTLESGESVPVAVFLPIYNKVTGRKEKSACSSCWINRVKLFKATLATYKDKFNEPAAEEEKASEKAHDEPVKQKRKPGRPKKTKDKNE